MQAEKLKSVFLQHLPAVDFASIRYHRDMSHIIKVRKNIVESPIIGRSNGYFITIIHQGGYGYAASSDLSTQGIKKAISHAHELATKLNKKFVIDFSAAHLPHVKGEFKSPVKIHWNSVTLPEKIAQMQKLSESMKIHSKIVDWEATLWRDYTEKYYFTNGSGEVSQVSDRLIPLMSVTASDGHDAQTRSLGGHAYIAQKGWEYLDDVEFWAQGAKLAEDAITLMEAPQCPTGLMDVILAPDQMVLQIHETIGHPLELDRILGDERNFAGTSFVNLEMFGHYQYGSPLLNITYDPSYDFQAASFAFDDDGGKAQKQFLIKDGILQKPLGGLISQKRANLEGVACTRADSWRRPPIDRMANLNLEPGFTSFEKMVEQVENGIYLKTNRSWSIDDSRNKFQFGCEWGQLIEKGRLTQIVKNPSYRGISATFWRSLKAVGDQGNFKIMGTPYCGKGEPNQVIYVGHATPSCLFGPVDVFGV